ncbi:lysine-specific demethylase JMJ31 isoform X2 [Salvia miltiorrhiza]|uniref:lysine-specific demethylase JMJ31 isoform X2 n=1 Tax=Salvia miltiorrhiza TaxID=226208 RepID=UPI0025ACBA52|nr:lysine-specific demethylase JMJ31 isoform X2 [Salvia miltiorrhiza]
MESLQIRRLDEIPSPEEFASQIEQKNVPAVFSGCAKEWKAFSKWNVSNGGLDYLQVSIVNTENEEKSQLECLRDDIETPAFLDSKTLASVNLWMNNAKSRSSTHYDPHHNLLCIISGCKQVVLWPPSASPFLYPLPVYGESSNHSAIPLENTNFSLYPRAKSIDKYSRKVTLHAGDALFIPEGWFHQVDSEDLTIAVNFWWQSDMMSSMPEHMDAYYLRRILKRLTDKEMDRMLSMPSTSKVNHMIGASGQSSNVNAGCCDEELNLNHQEVGGKEKLVPGFSLRELEPHELRSLHDLVSSVHEKINRQPAGNIPADQSVCREEDVKKFVKANLYDLEDDPIANTVWNLEPHVFQIVFLNMAHNFPRTLEAFVLHALSPVGVEVLTRKFEQMDQRIAPDERSQFYQKFYSVFDNQFAAMDALLNGKESFACQAFNNVLVQYLGINLNGPKPSLQ